MAAAVGWGVDCRHVCCMACCTRLSPVCVFEKHNNMCHLTLPARALE